MIVILCAWVLWITVYPVESSRAPEMITPLGAHLTKSQCDEAWFSAVARYRNDKEAGKETRDTIFTCLPDTIDPRKK